ncbi:hypothetical protein BASA83_002819 [Batrachochytrium salamandrivorans]|nr:hypothetical protein BASA83_002819 [Batrachochytrium salamandrivorans]
MTPAIRTSWKAVLVAALIGLSQAAVTDTHSVSIVLVVDDSYSLSIDGVKSEVPYSGSSWSTVKNLTKTLTGDGPWLISLAATDYGNVAGLFAAVNLDGVPYSTTATSTNKFRMTPLLLELDGTRTLYTLMASGTRKPVMYARVITRMGIHAHTLDSMTKGQVARSITKKMFFRLVLPFHLHVLMRLLQRPLLVCPLSSSRVAIVSPATASAAVPTTTVLSASHKIDVTMVVDDAYDLSLDGENHSVAVSDSSCQQQVPHDPQYPTSGGTPTCPTLTATGTLRLPTCVRLLSVYGLQCLTTLDKKTTGQVARGMWYPDCYNVGSFSNPKHMYFRMKVIAPKQFQWFYHFPFTHCQSLYLFYQCDDRHYPCFIDDTLVYHERYPISTIATTSAAPIVRVASSSIAVVVPTTSAAPIPYVASSSIAVVAPTTSAAPIPYVASSSIAVLDAVVVPTTSAAPIPYVASSSIAVVVPTTSVARIVYVASSSIAAVAATTSAAPILNVASSSIAVVVPTTVLLLFSTSHLARLLFSIAVVAPTTSVAPIVRVASSSIAVVAPTTSAAPIPYVESSSTAPAYAATSTSAAVKPTHKPVPRHRAHPRSDDTIVVIRLSDHSPNTSLMMSVHPEKTMGMMIITSPKSTTKDAKS